MNEKQKDILGRVLSKIKNDEAARNLYLRATSERYGFLSYTQLVNAAGNHVFDDHPSVFGLTEKEGSELRGWFQVGFESDFLEWTKA